MPITNGVTFTSFSLSFCAMTHGSLSQDSSPSVIRMIKFLPSLDGKSPAAASKDLAMGVAPFADTLVKLKSYYSDNIVDQRFPDWNFFTSNNSSAYS